MLKETVDTKLNAFEIYEIFRKESYSFFLDSSLREKNLGRYSFIGSNPFLVFKSKTGKIEITESNVKNSFEGNPFAEISNLLFKYKTEKSSNIPFVGGVVGYLSYDLCHHTENLPKTVIDDVDIPDTVMGFYDGIIAYDHKKNKCYVIAHGFKQDAAEIIKELREKITCKINTSIEDTEQTENGYLHSNITKNEYIDAIKKVKNYIKEGDVYQVNFTYRYECKVNEEPINIYKKLRKNNPAPFSCFLNFDDVLILSSSPERFMKIENREMETRPIKGTCPRGNTVKQNEENCAKLMQSEKDNAELMMIVDLERNDLGRVAKEGTVEVREPLHIEKYATVNHLVASVVGELKEKYTSIDGVKAAFPGGSITGAPKIRAMEIIDELEKNSRNIYTGCIGYIGFDGCTDLNIAIRTIIIKNMKAYFHVGGGIVWDSIPEEEYLETLDKASALIAVLQPENQKKKDGLFETIKITHGKILFFDEHIQRLKKSCKLINIEWNEDTDSIKKNAKILIKENKLIEGKLKLEYFKHNGMYNLIITADNKIYPKSNYENGISLMQTKVKRNSESVKCKIKSLDNEENLIEKEKANNLGFEEALFLNEDNYLCECSVSNIFWVKNGLIYTPSDECGLLKGTVRQKIIDFAHKNGISCIEGKYEIDELKFADEVFVTNSIMGIMPVSRITDKTYDIVNSNITKILRKEYEKLIITEINNKD